MKIFLRVLLLSTMLASPFANAVGNASEFDQSAWDQKMEAFTQMSGRTFEYTVSGYRIKLHFNAETEIAWERLETPDGTTGLKGTQTVDRQNVHPGIFIMAWSEQDGTHVVDIVDTQRMELFANFITADGQRFQTHAKLLELN